MNVPPHDFELQKLVSRDYVTIDGHAFLVQKVYATVTRSAPRRAGDDPARDVHEVDLTLVHAYWKCELDE